VIRAATTRIAARRPIRRLRINGRVPAIGVTPAAARQAAAATEADPA
jgi:hypothetical protein